MPNKTDCCNFYAKRHKVLKFNTADEPPTTEYLVRTERPYIFPHAKIITLDHGDGDSFIVLPSPELVPAIQPVFDHLEANPPDLLWEQIIGTFHTTCFYMLKTIKIPSDLHDITNRIVNYFKQ